MIKQNNPQETLKYAKVPFEMMDNSWVTAADAIIYTFMLNRYLFFKNLGKTYHENIEDIAKGSRQSVSSVNRTIKKLQEKNYIEVSKIKVKVGSSNSYIVHDIHKVNEQSTPKVPVTQIDTHPPVKKPRYSDKFEDLF